MKNPTSLTLAVLLLASFLAQAAPHAHSHGEGKLDISVEPKRITIQLESPLDNFVGFERAPRTDRERQQVEAALAKLKAADLLFKIDPAAQCQLSGVELASAALKLGKANSEDTQDTGHADIDGTFDFACADATKAGHIELGLFEFSRLHRLQVQVATPKGQFKRTLKRPTNRMLLTK